MAVVPLDQLARRVHTVQLLPGHAEAAVGGGAVGEHHRRVVLLVGR